MLASFEQALKVLKTFKTSPHTEGTCLRQRSRVNFCLADSLRVRQVLGTLVDNRELKQATFLTTRTPTGSESSRYSQ